MKLQPISGVQFSSIGHNLSQHLELGSNGAGINSNNQNLVDLGKQLLEACKEGDTAEVKSLIQNGAPFTTDWLGTSPLHFAAQYGHADTTEVLLKVGVSRDTRTKVDRTPLHIAAQEGHLDIVSLLVTYGADLDAKDLLRMTPLHWAVERGHRDVVECLLANGADANSSSKFDKTPLDIAYDVARNDLVPILQSYSTGSTSRQIKVETLNKSNTPSTRTRPTVLPNKVNRTSRMMPLVSNSSQSTPRSVKMTPLVTNSVQTTPRVLKVNPSTPGSAQSLPQQPNITITSTPGGKVLQVKQGLTLDNMKKLLASMCVIEERDKLKKENEFLKKEVERLKKQIRAQNPTNSD